MKELIENKRLEGTDFFDNIRRSVKTSHFVASIIPLALLVYFSIRYVVPYVTGGDMSKVPIDIGILLLLAVAVSVLGLILTTKATNSSIASAQELNTKLNSLFDITKQLRETMYHDVLLKNIIESAMSLTNTECGSLLLYKEDGLLQIKVNVGKDTGKMTNKVIESGHGVAAWVSESGESAMINDVSKDPRYNPEFDDETGFKTNSVLCVPLVHADKIIGAIELRNKMKGEFTSQDEVLLNSLADHASISIAQNNLSEKQHSDFIHITEILVSAQDYIQKRKGHARRVAGYANRIGKQIHFSEKDLKQLYHASLLHDIGILKTDSDDLLNKHKPIQHPKVGYDLTKSISMWSESADIILHHHERYDGKGYPLAKKGVEIPIGARVLIVADTFDVLTSEYESGQQLDFNNAIQEIERNAGTMFDPHIVEAFRTSMTDAGLIT